MREFMLQAASLSFQNCFGLIQLQRQREKLFQLMNLQWSECLERTRRGLKLFQLPRPKDFSFAKVTKLIFPRVSSLARCVNNALHPDFYEIKKSDCSKKANSTRGKTANSTAERSFLMLCWACIINKEFPSVESTHCRRAAWNESNC